MNRKLIAVSGNIASGKTTLVRALATILGWRSEIESFSANPYLTDFYNDMAAWAFPTQLCFLLDRATQHEKLAQVAAPVIMERSLLEDKNVFAATLFEMGYLTDRESELYSRVFSAVTKRLRNPDVVLYLHASPKVLLSRIAERGRANEAGMKFEYIRTIGEKYVSWVRSLGEITVLQIDAERHDFRRAEEVRWIADKLKAITS